MVMTYVIKRLEKIMMVLLQMDVVPPIFVTVGISMGCCGHSNVVNQAKQYVAKM